MLRYLESAARSSAGADGYRSRAPALVLLHAFPLNARMWEPQQRLAERGWRVIAPQYRGFDTTSDDGPEAQAIDDYAADVAALIEALGVAPAVVCGLSMGGYVALALMRRAPHLCRALVLADTRADADTADARNNRTRLIDLVAAEGVPALAEQMVPRLLGRSTLDDDPATVNRVRNLIAATRPGALQAALRAMMTRTDSTALLPSIAVPTLVLAGEEDHVAPPEVARSMAAAIPEAACTVIPRAGHLASLEQPEAFNAVLGRFLDGLYS